jgi:hypothetical protein
MPAGAYNAFMKHSMDDGDGGKLLILVLASVEQMRQTNIHTHIYINAYQPTNPIYNISHCAGSI